MLKIISDSPYRSKRVPVSGQQNRSTVRATTIGTKTVIRPKKKTAKKAKLDQ